METIKNATIKYINIGFGIDKNDSLLTLNIRVEYGDSVSQATGHIVLDTNKPDHKESSYGTQTIMKLLQITGAYDISEFVGKPVRVKREEHTGNEFITAIGHYTKDVWLEIPV